MGIFAIVSHWLLKWLLASSSCALKDLVCIAHFKPIPPMMLLNLICLQHIRMAIEDCSTALPRLALCSPDSRLTPCDSPQLGKHRTGHEVASEISEEQSGKAYLKMLIFRQHRSLSKFQVGSCHHVFLAFFKLERNLVCNCAALHQTQVWRYLHTKCVWSAP